MSGDQYFSDVTFLQRLILGEGDPLTQDALAGLFVLHAHYSRFDAGMGDLIRRAFEAHNAAVERAEEAADRAYLKGLIDGSGDLLAEDTFARMEPMFAKYPEGSDMYATLERAAQAFSNAALEAATRFLATEEIERIRREGLRDVDD